MLLQPQPLRGFDEECRRFITEQYAGRGLRLHPEFNPERIEKQADGTLTLHLKSKSGETTVLEGLDQVLMATGRKPNTRGLGLEDVRACLHTALIDCDWCCTANLSRGIKSGCSSNVEACR